MLRRDSRLCWEPFVVSIQARLKSEGAYVIVGGPSGRWMIGVVARVIHGTCLIEFREPTAGFVDAETE